MMKWQAACAFLEDCHFQDARQEQVGSSQHRVKQLQKTSVQMVGTVGINLLPFFEDTC